MYAVIKVAGKQFRVAKGDTILIDQPETQAVEASVLMFVNGTTVTTDAESLKKAKVKLSTDGVVRERLARTMKFKPKQGRTSKRIMGHRRVRTRVRIEDLSLS